MRQNIYAAAALFVVIVLLFPLILAASPFQQVLQDGAHNHPQYETALALNATGDSQNRATDLYQSTEIARLWLTLDTHSIATLVSTFTATRTPIPSNTPIIPTSTAPPPTQEIVVETFTRTPTFVNATNTATRTPTRIVVTLSPTSTGAPSVTPSPSAECQANGDFVPNTIINRRNAGSVSGTLLQPQLQPGIIEVVCTETLTNVDSNGYRWIRIAETPNQEWFAVGRMENGVFNWFGTLTSWRD